MFWGLAHSSEKAISVTLQAHRNRFGYQPRFAFFFVAPRRADFFAFFLEALLALFFVAASFDAFLVAFFADFVAARLGAGVFAFRFDATRFCVTGRGGPLVSAGNSEAAVATAPVASGTYTCSLVSAGTCCGSGSAGFRASETAEEVVSTTLLTTSATVSKTDLFSLSMIIFLESQ
jgi:hypothetical protein